MSDPIGKYISQDLAKRFRKQAFRVWTISLVVVLVWVGLILLAPVAMARGLQNISSPLYTFFSYICHQLPERSLHIEGHHLAVCSRCFGVYFGLLFGFLIYPFWRNIEEIEPLARFWLFLSLVPISIDWALTMFGVWENTHLSRFITGLILGAVCATFIIPALVEITRNFSAKKDLSTPPADIV